MLCSVTKILGICFRTLQVVKMILRIVKVDTYLVYNVVWSVGGGVEQRPSLLQMDGCQWRGGGVSAARAKPQRRLLGKNL